ncbi:SIR2 family protein [Aeromicrobium halocynthiae]|uniref:SIR2 family protein n=1 Tax=Aeromicrobium halocynthiae TaxID=560557 RepID=UPI0031DDFEA8
MSGTVFVVHGRLEDLTWQGAVIVTDDRGLVGKTWRGLSLSQDAPLDMSDGWALVPADVPVAAVSIEATYDVVLDRIDHCLERFRSAISRDHATATPPLVAVPVVGIGRGGFGDDRGEILRRLLERLASTTRRLGLDVAVVTPDPSVYAAAQHLRRGGPSVLPPELENAARDLGGLAARGRLALFTGAGVSAPSGLPTWTTLLGQLADLYDISDLIEETAGLSATDVAGLIEQHAPKTFQADVAARFTGDHRPSLLHALLAGLDAHEVVTTNYDLLFERAVEATGRGITSVLPWQSAVDNERWILKLHGDVDHADQSVLTRHHMVRYDAANRPSASLLQSLLLTRHTLFVGLSMSDDNVIRLMHEVQEYRRVNEAAATGRFGTVLDVRGDAARASLWQDQLHWLDLSVSDLGPGTRVIRLFLDRVAVHAARDASWLLDERFAGLLPPEHREVARLARDLNADLPADDGPWAVLRAALRELGATPPD